MNASTIIVLVIIAITLVTALVYGYRHNSLKACSGAHETSKCKGCSQKDCPLQKINHNTLENNP